MDEIVGYGNYKTTNKSPMLYIFLIIRHSASLDGKKTYVIFFWKSKAYVIYIYI